MKKIALALFVLISFTAASQGGYEIKVNIKNFNDSVVYLAKYYFGKQYIVDTCSKINKGSFVFKGKKTLDKGIYFFVNKDKAHMFDFILNESSKFTFNSDVNEMQLNLRSPDSKENEDFFAYTRYYMTKNKEFGELREKTKSMNKADSAKFIQEKVKVFTDDVTKFEESVVKAQQGTFFGDWLNLKTEKEVKVMPTLKNASDSAYYRFNYYKWHYWDGVNFKDDRLLGTQFFEERLKKYFDQIVQQLGPDSVIVDMDRILMQCPKEGEMFKYLYVHFMTNYENHKLMGFDKIFVHLVDAYLKTGIAKSIYDETTVGKIIEKSDRTKPLLIGAVAPELMMMDTTTGKLVNKMGFDTASTSESITKLYYANMQKLMPLYKTLSSVKAKYTILIFWDVECGHCQTEMPKLLEAYHELKKTVDVQVFSVYTLTEYEKWRKYIIDKKHDFINVYDPVHINNVKNKYDIFSTPKVYVLDKNKVIKSKHMPVEKIPELIKIYEEEEKKAGTK